MVILSRMWDQGFEVELIPISEVEEGISGLQGKWVRHAEGVDIARFKLYEPDCSCRSRWWKTWGRWSSRS